MFRARFSGRQNLSPAEAGSLKFILAVNPGFRASHSTLGYYLAIRFADFIEWLTSTGA